MTLRIFVEADDAQATVALHGRLSVAEVAEVERVVAAQDRPLRIDLAHLTGADADGLTALRRLRARGACLTEASPFFKLMLEQTADVLGAEAEAVDDGVAE